MFAHRVVWCLITALCVARCGSESPKSERTFEALSVLFFGCSEIFQGPECRIHRHSPKVLSFWINDVKSTSITVFVDGAPREINVTAQAEGAKLTIAVPPPPATIEIVAGTQSESSVTKVRRWTLQITTSRIPSEIHQARVARQEGNHELATAMLKPWLSSENTEAKGEAWGQWARLALARGDHRETIKAFEISISLHRKAQAISSEMYDRYALAYVMVAQGQLGRLEQILDPVASIASMYPAGALEADYYRGNAALTLGDYRSALRYFSRILIYAERLDMARMWSAAAELRTRILWNLGRVEEARSLLQQIIKRVPDEPTCLRAYSLHQAGRLTREISNEPQDLEQARSLLLRAAAYYSQKCPQPRWHAYTLATVGLTELAADQPTRASSWLVASRAAYAAPGIGLRRIQERLAGEIALATQNFGLAAVSFRRMAEAAASVHPAARWRGLLGEGHALESLGRFDDAVMRYQAAEDLLDDFRFSAPLGQGREGLLHNRSESAQRLIALLIQQGRVDEAWSVARKSRMRSLSAVAWPVRLASASEPIRKQWYLSWSKYQEYLAKRWALPVPSWEVSAAEKVAEKAEQLRVLEDGRFLLDQALAKLGEQTSLEWYQRTTKPGVIEILYHPLLSGWVAFVKQHATPTIVRTLETVPLDASQTVLGHLLLEPFSEQLRKATQVRILAFGKLDSVDFHALPWRNRPLVASLSVSYGLDIGVDRLAGATDQPVGSLGAEALVVDPHADLVAAQQEAQYVQRSLEAGGWLVHRLTSTTATGSQLMRLLSSRRFAWFHYAGHARHTGLDGWNSYLGTNSEVMLTLGDILLLPQTPRVVVLFGCESGASTENDSPPGLGLAQAFVLAGSRWAIAARRRLHERDAISIATQLYARVKHADTPLSALRETQLALIRSDSKVDWSSLRIFEP